MDSHIAEVVEHVLWSRLHMATVLTESSRAGLPAHLQLYAHPAMQ
jgi:hypothetical protein